MRTDLQRHYRKISDALVWKPSCQMSTFPKETIYNNRVFRNEVSLIYRDALEAYRNVNKWSKTTTDSFSLGMHTFGTRTAVRREPKGVVLIIRYTTEMSDDVELIDIIKVHIIIQHDFVSVHWLSFCTIH